MEDDNEARLNELLVRTDPPIGPGNTDAHRHPDPLETDLLMPQRRLEAGFPRLVAEAIKPTMEAFGLQLDQQGHGYAITEHSVESSQVLDFVIIGLLTI